MRKFMFVTAIASLSIVNAGAALAQAAVGEPGLDAFNHPDADILHAGPGYSRFAPNRASAGVGAGRQTSARAQAQDVLDPGGLRKRNRQGTLAEGSRAQPRCGQRPSAPATWPASSSASI